MHHDHRPPTTVGLSTRVGLSSVQPRRSGEGQGPWQLDMCNRGRQLLGFVVHYSEPDLDTRSADSLTAAVSTAWRMSAVTLLIVVKNTTAGKLVRSEGALLDMLEVRNRHVPAVGRGPADGPPLSSMCCGFRGVVLENSRRRTRPPVSRHSCMNHARVG